MTIESSKANKNSKSSLTKKSPASITPIAPTVVEPQNADLVDALEAPTEQKKEATKTAEQTITPVSTQAPKNSNTHETKTTSPEVKDTQVSDGDLMASVQRAGAAVGERVFQTYAAAATTSLEHVFTTRIPEFNRRFAGQIRTATAKQSEDLHQRLTGSGSSPSIAIEASAVDSLPAAKDTDGEG